MNSLKHHLAGTVCGLLLLSGASDFCRLRADELVPAPNPVSEQVAVASPAQAGQRVDQQRAMRQQPEAPPGEPGAPKQKKKAFRNRTREADMPLHLLGTLGRTYYRESHAVPSAKHPRAGMLAIRTNKPWPISVDGMSGIRLQSGIWLFESNRPLDLGVSNVVRVEHRRNVNDIEATSYRFVRLIPGRVVYLNFDVDSLP